MEGSVILAERGHDLCRRLRVGVRARGDSRWFLMAQVASGAVQRNLSRRATPGDVAVNPGIVINELPTK
eukprot:491163-Lingulodinium_polyedra.AAC.1